MSFNCLSPIILVLPSQEPAPDRPDFCQLCINEYIYSQAGTVTPKSIIRFHDMIQAEYPALKLMSVRYTDPSDSAYPYGPPRINWYVVGPRDDCARFVLTVSDSWADLK